MFNETIRKHRNKQGWTQEQLARNAGTTRANIAKIETGAYLPSLYLTLRILEALQIPESYQLRRLIYGHDRKQYGR